MVYDPKVLRLLVQQRPILKALNVTVVTSKCYSTNNASKIFTNVLLIEVAGRFKLLTPTWLIYYQVLLSFTSIMETHGYFEETGLE